ncbi:hypothetical protein KFK09_012937 [Dendrobium nobile]|uniref:Uncharacterized protein n=1 Tax=Dendrobium nobile TaxID=94219 RepID=A0A8T3BM88_DENNO|nr:hypothetical protein KFK09_012937 [Dendrobium nobile]
MEYIGCDILSSEKKKFLDEGFMKFTAKNHTIFSSGNIIIYRSGIDELLSDTYLDNNHADAFTILLDEKSKFCPNKYYNFLYARYCIGYKARNLLTKLFIKHINIEAVKSCNIILQLVINGVH